MFPGLRPPSTNPQHQPPPRARRVLLPRRSPAVPPPPCPANFPTSRQVEKPESRKVEKLASRHTPPTTKDGGAPAYRGEFITPLPPPARLTPPGGPANAAKRPNPVPFSYPGVNQETTCCTLHPAPASCAWILRLPPRLCYPPTSHHHWRPPRNAAKRPSPYLTPTPFGLSRQLSDFPTSRKAGKSKSWQVGTRHHPLAGEPPHNVHTPPPTPSSLTRG